MVWASVGGESSRLVDLAERLSRRFEPLGFPPEARALSPHVTLARARGDRGVRGLAPALAVEPRNCPWKARELVLFRSVLSPGGPRYTPLRRMRFGSPAELEPL